MSHPNKYQKQATLGLIGLFFVVSPLFLKLPSQFQAFSENTQLETETASRKTQIENSEDLERTRIEQKKQTADKLQQTGVLPTGQKLKISPLLSDSEKWGSNPDSFVRCRWL